jgi:ferritin
MINETIRAALSKQFNNELHSSYTYLAMAAWCDEHGLKGFANWMRVQAQEEMAHAMILHNYLRDQSAHLDFFPVAAPHVEADSIRALFDHAFKHEQGVTASFLHIASLARDASDFATGNFIQFFIDEQVEEESSFRDIMDQLKLIGDAGHVLFMLDREMAQRAFVMPAQLAKN